MKGRKFRMPPGIGTPFQRRVWRITARIPRGRTRTYGSIARELKSSPRAVGQALRVNPFAPRVPCHRVVAAGGKVGGFGGKWNSRKKRELLRREGVTFAR